MATPPGLLYRSPATTEAPDMDTDKPTGMALGERWVMLRELAEIREISQHSAARLVRRHGWRRQTDNRGQVQALVPAEALDIPPAGPDKPTAGAITRRELAAALEPLNGLLREQLEHERARADREQARADTAERRANTAAALAESRGAELRTLAEARARAELENAGVREALAEARRPAWRRWPGLKD